MPTTVRRMVIAFAIPIALATALNAAVPLPSERERWIHVTAGDFQIYSNASEREARRVATNLLRMQQALGAITKLNVRSPHPTWVYLFQDAASFSPFRDAIVGRPSEFAGFFVSRRDANFVLLRLDAPSGSTRIVYHELTHFFVRNTVANPPPWLNEGLAEYYSTFETSGEHVSLGKVIPHHVSTLRSQAFIPLRQFFAMDHQAYTESERIGIYYAEAWAVMHYLLTQTDGRALREFLSLLASGGAPEHAFRQAFGTTYDDFEARLRSYVGRLVFEYRSYTLRTLDVPEIPPAENATRASSLRALARLLAVAPQPADAEAFLDEAMRLEPTDPEAHLLLATICERSGSREAAAAQFAKAMELGSKDPEPYLRSAEAIARSTTGDDRAEVLRARELFQRAAALDANSVRALSGIGWSYAVLEEDAPGPGIAALEKAITAGATDFMTINLVVLYARAGRDADAFALTAKSFPSTGNGMRDAYSSIASEQTRRAHNLAQSGQRAEAVRLLTTAIASAPDASKPPLQMALNALTAATASDWSEYQKAVDRANAGRYTEALKIADRLLSNTTDPTFRQQLQSFRKEVSKRAKR